MDEGVGVKIPADVEREDKIVAGLTARQTAILASTGVVLWLIYMALRAIVPPLVYLGGAVPIAALVTAVALGRRDGLSLDRLALHALRHVRTPHRLVTAPDGITPAPAWVAASTGPLPAPLRLPARGIRGDGVIELGGDGAAVIISCSTVSFALATPGEQHAMVTAFGRWLNSASGPVQVLVRAERVNVSPLISALREAAAGLPHPALEQAALEHAAYLSELDTTRDLLWRQVLLVVREPVGRGGADANAARALRRAEEATRALAGIGITAHLLEGAQAMAVISDACDPYSPPPSPTSTGDHHGHHAGLPIGERG